MRKEKRRKKNLVSINIIFYKGKRTKRGSAQKGEAHKKGKRTAE